MAVLYFILIIFSTFPYALNAECNLVINEIQLNNPVKPDKNDFIELKLYCSGVEKIPSLQGYFIIAISGNPAGHPIIELSASLWNSKMKKGGYFVIGGTSLKNKDLSINSSFVTFRDKGSKSTED